MKVYDIKEEFYQIQQIIENEEFNEETGEFDISGMELHRLREVAKAANVDMTTLAESAKRVAKFSKIKGEIGGSIDEKTAEFISSIAEYDNAYNRCVVSEYEKPEPRERTDLKVYCDAKAKEQP